MTQPEKNTDKSFWQKISDTDDSKSPVEILPEDNTNAEKNSLVESIVRQAEAASVSSAEPVTEQEAAKEIVDVSAELSLAKTVLNLVLVLAIGLSAFFYATLDEANTWYGKFGRQNLTTQVNTKQTYSDQIRTDLVDLKKFVQTLAVEEIASQINGLDMENKVLTYERPAGELIDGKYRWTNSEGVMVELGEDQILIQENTAKAQRENAQNLLKQIVDHSSSIDAQLLDAQISTQFKVVQDNLSQIDLAEEKFPSPTTRALFAAAQSSAGKILVTIKEANFQNLINDLKKQANALDATGLSEEVAGVISKIKTLIEGLNAKQPSKFAEAQKQIASLDLSLIDDTATNQKITGLIGEDRQSGDLGVVTEIAGNLGRVTIVNTLVSDRISWSQVLDRIEKINRLGSDLTADEGKEYHDSRRDLDPDNNYATFTGFTGRGEKGLIEVKGDALGSGRYAEKNFSFLSDLIDALEGSKFFKDVEGFMFNKNRSADGKYRTPINLKLTIQEPDQISSKDWQMPADELKLDETNLPDFSNITQPAESSESTQNAPVEAAESAPTDTAPATTPETTPIEPATTPTDAAAPVSTPATTPAQ